MTKSARRGGVAIVTGLLLGLAGCIPGASGDADAETVDQREYCHVSDVQRIDARCNDGELMALLPSAWGNQQLPLFVIAAACNTNYPVYHNDAGVVCVYTDARVDEFLGEQ